jgi:hypothetical protein
MALSGPLPKRHARSEDQLGDTMKRTFYAVSVIVCLMAFSAPGYAKNLSNQLRGNFKSTSFASCLAAVGATSPFTAQLTVPGNIGAFTETFSLQSSITFNGDGTGTESGVSVQVRSGSIGVNEYEGTFTYTINPDLSVTFTSSGITGTTTAGPGSGDEFTNEGILETGQISADGNSLVVSTTEPALETVTITSPATGQTQTQFRYCNRSSSLVRVN